MKKNSILLFSFFTIGAVIGWLIGGHRHSIFGIIKLSMLTGLICIIYFLALIIYQGKVKKTLEIIKLSCFCFVISVVFSVVHYIMIAYNKQQHAEKIISKIEFYRKLKSKNPQKLIEVEGITPDEVRQFHYDNDSTNQYFKLSYSIDGWHIKEYDSKYKLWVTTD